MMSDENVSPPPVSEFSPATPPPVRTGIMGLLADSRQKIMDAQVLRLEVPRWGPPHSVRVAVEYKPVPHAILRRGANEQERRTKDSNNAEKQASTEVDTNADILINGCLKIIAILEDGEEMGFGIDGTYTRFDRDLAFSLGIPESSTARQVCRELFITEADLLRTARQVSKWSGYTDEDIDETLEGE